MPIRVTCPNCGRVGRGPDHAVGRTVQCPACFHRHRLSAEMVLPEDDGEPTANPTADSRSLPRIEPSPPPAPKPKTRPQPGPSDDAYDLDTSAVELPSRPIKPRPSVPAPVAALDDDHPVGITLTAPVLMGGAVAVALLSILAAWAVVGVFRAGAAVDRTGAASASSRTPPASPIAATPAPAAMETALAVLEADPPLQKTANPAPAEPSIAPDHAPSSVPARTTDGEISVAEAMLPFEDLTSGPVRETAAHASPPSKVVVPEPAMISVAEAMEVIAKLAPPPAPEPERQPVVDTLPTSDDVAPEAAGESDVAARARAGAATVAARDDGAGKPSSTADIVAESESSVALIKGKATSGTGFLVAPGLMATNSHVVGDEFISDLEVRFVSADDEHNAPLRAELLFEDPERDLAFLAVDTDLKPLRVAGAYAFRKGEDVTVIGNPSAGDGQVLENAISRGVMSTKTRINNREFHQLGVAINPGYSGGPVFDSSGRVIGVATLKSLKQEATGFSIPIEDLHAALTKLSKESAAVADRYRSQHRIKAAVEGLGGGGALMCLLISLRRADKNNAAVKDLLGKLEPVTADLDKDYFPSLVGQALRTEKDLLIDTSARGRVAELTENFRRIHNAYAAGGNVDDGRLRPWKQTHKRLITELAAALKLEIPDGLMLAFDDHPPAQSTLITMGPRTLGLYGSRLRQRSLGPGLGVPRTPRGIVRPPSLRDRLRRGGIR